MICELNINYKKPFFVGMVEIRFTNMCIAHNEKPFKLPHPLYIVGVLFLLSI